MPDNDKAIQEARARWLGALRKVGHIDRGSPVPGAREAVSYTGPQSESYRRDLRAWERLQSLKDPKRAEVKQTAAEKAQAATADWLEKRGAKG